MDQNTEITQKPLSTTKKYTRGSLKSLIISQSLSIVSGMTAILKLPERAASMMLVLLRLNLFIQDRTIL